MNSAQIIYITPSNRITGTRSGISDAIFCHDQPPDRQCRSLTHLRDPRHLNSEMLGRDSAVVELPITDSNGNVRSCEYMHRDCAIDMMVYSMIMERRSQIHGPNSYTLPREVSALGLQTWDLEMYLSNFLYVSAMTAGFMRVVTNPSGHPQWGFTPLREGRVVRGPSEGWTVNKVRSWSSQLRLDHRPYTQSADRAGTSRLGPDWDERESIEATTARVFLGDTDQRGFQYT